MSGNTRQPMRIRNLAGFKRAIRPGTEFMTTSHSKHPDLVGLVRVVTEVQSNAFYSKVKGQPEHPYSTCNYGKGFRSDFEKANCYRFNGSAITVYDPRSKEPKVLYEMEVYAHAMEMENNIQQEEHTMNEWERLRRQAERNKQLYPPGTRVLLLHMGDDPRPVEDNVRGTVKYVDDAGTIHCNFDNGRGLGLIPGEDSFRKLTEQELAQEQQPELSGPTMEM